VIDMQGICSNANAKSRNEKDRRNADEKLVLFCLSISDLTIVNAQGSFESRS
jgi:hypothetical protein